MCCCLCRQVASLGYGQDRVRLAVIASVVKGAHAKGRGWGARTVEGDSTSERGSSPPWRTRVLQVLETIHSWLPSTDRACASKPAVFQGRVPRPANMGNNSVNNGQVKAKRIFGIGAKRLLSASLPGVWSTLDNVRGHPKRQTHQPFANGVRSCCHVCIQVRKHAGPTWRGALPNGSVQLEDRCVGYFQFLCFPTRGASAGRFVDPCLCQLNTNTHMPSHHQEQ